MIYLRNGCINWSITINSASFAWQ